MSPFEAELRSENSTTDLHDAGSFAADNNSPPDHGQTAGKAEYGHEILPIRIQTISDSNSREAPKSAHMGTLLTQYRTNNVMSMYSARKNPYSLHASACFSDNNNIINMGN